MKTTNKNNTELSIVIPCYNEEKNIALIIDKLKESLNSKENNDFELILVDNGSKDKTREEIKKYAQQYSNIRLVVVENNIGYGNGIFQGIKEAKGEFVCWTHADLQTDPNDCFKALELIKKQENPEMCFVKGKRYGRPFFDKIFEFGMSVFESLILRKRLYDINAQPNLFHKSFLKKIGEPPKEFSFDLFFYYSAKSLKYKMIKFDVYYGKRIHGKSTWNTGIMSKWKLIKRTLGYSFGLKKKLKEKTS